MVKEKIIQVVCNSVEVLALSNKGNIFILANDKWRKIGLPKLENTEDKKPVTKKEITMDVNFELIKGVKQIKDEDLNREADIALMWCKDNPGKTPTRTLTTSRLLTFLRNYPNKIDNEKREI